MFERLRIGLRRGFSFRQVELMNTLRMLWEQHVMWTRSFIISTAADLPDLELVTERLLRNPTDFANVLRPFYGDERAREFEQLFREHLLIAGQLVGAAKAGDTKRVAEEHRKWFINAAQIAAFLARINPFWDRDEWQKMLFEHLTITEAEAVARLSGEYAEDIKLYDQIEAQALAMADEMSRGIIRQFRI